jgi:chemotaxis family two-component system response regulator Rcp1
MNTHTSAPIDVLLVDDSPEDVRLTREALKGSRFRIHLEVATNGEEALAVLRHQGRHGNASRTNLVLLDLNMPRMDGREMLAIMKQDAELKCIPVVVLTTSDSESDIRQTYELHANAYVTKPAHVDQFESTMKAIENFWIGVAKLPGRGFGAKAYRD